MSALSILEYLLPMNVTVLAFDFAGCGLSEGEYISLGPNEADDLRLVVEYIRTLGTVSSIGIWGRSMGAVAALYYCSKDPSIAGLVLDSPFGSLKKLVKHLVSSNTKIPKFIVRGALKMVRKSIMSRMNIDIYENNPL